MPVTIEHDVPRTGWRQFCRSWGRAHHGWLVTVVGPDASETAERPLGGIAMHGATAVTVVLDGQPPREVEVEGVTAIREQLLGDGAHLGLAVDGAGGTTRILLRTAIAPEQVDGLRA